MREPANTYIPQYLLACEERAILLRGRGGEEDNVKIGGNARSGISCTVPDSHPIAAR